tara:strand:- start:359 stop:724 length:366 start_codon:yes stop_codon:yes gene_type:complete
MKKITVKFIREIKEDPIKRRNDLVRELEVDAVQVAENDYDAKFPEYGNKDDENAAEVAAFEKNLSLEKTMEISLYNVNKALSKIEKNKYGFCEKCNSLIDKKRLKAFPSATACMNCKKKFL